MAPLKGLRHPLLTMTMPALAGAVASTLPLLALAATAWIDYQRHGSALDANGIPDDVPIRTVGAVIFVWPVLVVAGTLYYLSLRASLDRWGGGVSLKKL
jgi:hypothetical protein